MKHIVLALFFFIFSAGHANAALYINEFSSRTSPDWVEIFNSGPDSVDLSTYYVIDTSSNRHDLSGNISANSFITFDWGNSLNNGGDTIKLYLETGNTLIDEIVFGSNGTAAPTETQSSGRSPDGSENWSLLTSPSKGTSNNSSSIVPTATPTSTPAPTNTPTPTPSPKPSDPTSTPTPTKSPTAVPTKTPTKSPTPAAQAVALKVSPRPTEKSKIGIRDGSNTGASVGRVMGSNSMSVNDGVGQIPKDNTNYNWGKLLIIIGGVVSAAGIGFLIYNNYREEKVEEA